MMPWPRNPRIQRWLERGNATEALLGRGGYFVRDHDWVTEHDRILVANQLLLWAYPDHTAEAADALNGAVKTLVDEGNLHEVVDLIWSYVLVAEDDHRPLPIDRTLFDSALDRAGMAHLERTPEAHVHKVKQRLLALSADGDERPSSRDIERR